MAAPPRFFSAGFVFLLLLFRSHASPPPPSFCSRPYSSPFAVLAFPDARFLFTLSLSIFHSLVAFLSLFVRLFFRILFVRSPALYHGFFPCQVWCANFSHKNLKFFSRPRIRFFSPTTYHAPVFFTKKNGAPKAVKLSEPHLRRF